MARQSLLDASTVRLSDLLSNGNLYRVPPFQRDYSWEGDQWEELWRDIEELDGQDREHYMGAIVLQVQDDHYVVIDGQQRLATISVLALAVLDRLRRLAEDSSARAENRERFDLLFAQFIGSKDPASLVSSSKLRLNANDDDFYQQYLVRFREPFSARKLHRSQGLIWSAFQFFSERLTERFGATPDGAELAAFLAAVARRLAFIRIQVEDELNAYTLFETLNARGLELTAADLLKNYLMSLVAASESDLDHAQKQWRDATGRIRASKLSEFLRHFLNSRRRFVRSEALFKEIKAEIKTREQVFPFLEDLQRASIVYSALEDASDDFWVDYPECSKYVRTLVLFRATQFRPVILAYFAKSMPKPDLETLLRACVAITFRYTVIGRRNPQDLERAYNDTALAIAEGESRNAADAIEKLRAVYVSDEDFRRTFELAAMETAARRKQAAYALGELEAHLSGAAFDPDSTAATVEHILPENPGVGWEHWDEEARERCTYRLGNLTLLERTKNKNAGNAAFTVKRGIYATSQYRLTQRIQTDEWTPDSVQARQREMAKWATSVWRLG